ncbi:hypothetical protein Q7A53_08215 [Halobacillus rhizosphaerae]|uniref:hypothetical protein n=1 Tax=Halobacillus rhizosphaerae TaxID=3064889 RepID=UPI00398A9772
MKQEPQTKATWIWNTSQIDGREAQAVEFAQEEKVNLIYLHVGKNDFDPQTYRTFIKEAHQKGIEVFALGGDPAWALSKHEKSIDKFVQNVKEFNEKVPDEEKFSGIHVDIEPYLLPEWKKNQDQVIDQWTGNVKHLIRTAKANTNLKVSGDFPFWLYKVKDPETKESLGKWMISQLDSITIMAYRDNIQGRNGIKSIATPLVEQAANQQKSVIVAVNLMKMSDEKHTTFYNQSPAQMKGQLVELRKEFHGHPGFGGIAIHDYSHWKKWMKLNS